jgi:hypothetical protein
MTNPRLIIYLLCVLTATFVLPVTSRAQDYRVSGTVIDSKTREPLAFVNIVINSSNYGGTTDIDGKFRLGSPDKVQMLRFSYVGYEQKLVPVGTRTDNLLITLDRKEIELTEVEILPGENPAHRIIRNAIDNRDLNDPEKLQSFSYTSYDKTVFSIDADTSLKSPFSDSAARQQLSQSGITFQPAMDSAQSDSAVMDSADRLIQKLIREQYLFLMENVTKRKFMAPDRNYNQVIATKMSGFKDPIFVFLTTQIQSFSFYKPFITIFQSSYINPIGAGSFSKYFFKLEDTTYTGGDTVFIISFRPRKGTNFTGLQGVISINSHGWAIQNVIAEPYGDEGGISIKIQQMYELIDHTWWFPVQLNTDVSFRNLQIGKYKAVGRGRYYIRDIVLNPDMVRKEFNHLDIEVEPEATDRTQEFWDQYRVDSLSVRDKRTYEVIDSLGKAENFDQMAKTLQTLMSGQIPWGPIGFDIDKFLGYNTYEGLIFGLGIHTNDRLSKKIKIGGFYQFASAVVESKYGGDVSYLINRKHDVTIAARYYFDRIESGGVTFFDDKESLLDGNYRQLMLRLLDRTQSAGASFTFRTRKYLLINAQFNWSHKQTNNYALATYEGDAVILEDDFIFTEAGVGLKWAYGEKFIQTVENKISLGTRYPVLWLQYTRGIKGFLDGEYDYNRFDLKLRKTFRIKYLGKATVQLNAGYVDRPIPACNLYNGHGSYRIVSFYTQPSFGTMRMNEFLSNGYAALFLYHDFEDLIIKGRKWFHPEFAIAQNIGFGFLDHADQYAYFRDGGPQEMNLGYYESGILVNNIVKLSLLKIGAGVFYRWGPYTLPKTGDNFSYKISIFIPLTNN